MMFRIFILFSYLLILTFSFSCKSTARFNSKTSPAVNVSITKTEVNADETTGKASYYGPKYHGRLTASGETFDMYQMTAAHRKLPFGTKVKVTNSQNGQSVIVRINDRGPFVGNRIIDVSYAAAKNLDMITQGVIPVKLEILN